MENHRKEKVAEVIREAVSSFIESESNRRSMITVTNVDLTKDFKRVIVFVTVFPEQDEVAAMDFLLRSRSRARDYLKRKSRLPRIPTLDFKIDGGEKSRQRIDEVSRNL